MDTKDELKHIDRLEAEAYPRPTRGKTYNNRQVNRPPRKPPRPSKVGPLFDPNRESFEDWVKRIEEAAD